jgi:hypothetical protein
MQITKLTALLVMVVITTTTAHAQTLPTSDTTTIRPTFEQVEIEATFPGDEAGWRSFLGKNLNPHVPVDNGAPVGKYTVYVQFVVAKNGTLSDVKALTSLGYGMEAEVLRIIKRSGNWNPAIQHGKPVNAYRKQPVTFMVTMDGFDIRSEVPYVLFARKDNELFIDVRKVKAKDLKVTISRGTIHMTDDGKFIARVNEPGRIIITVNNKKNKRIAEVSFEVRE